MFETFRVFRISLNAFHALHRGLAALFVLSFGFHGLGRAFGVFPVNGVVLLAVASAFTLLLVLQRVFTGVLQPLLLRTDILHNVIVLHMKLQVLPAPSRRQICSCSMISQGGSSRQGCERVCVRRVWFWRAFDLLAAECRGFPWWSATDVSGSRVVRVAGMTCRCVAGLVCGQSGSIRAPPGSFVLVTMGDDSASTHGHPFSCITNVDPLDDSLMQVQFVSRLDPHPATVWSTGPMSCQCGRVCLI